LSATIASHCEKSWGIYDDAYNSSSSSSNNNKSGRAKNIVLVAVQCAVISDRPSTIATTKMAAPWKYDVPHDPQIIA
jgi:hypothetical protein